MKITFSQSKLTHGKINSSIKKLPEVFSDVVLTTNFDKTLEYVYLNNDLQFEEVIYPCFYEKYSKTILGNRHNLIKLHGDIDENSFVVFTKKQYDTFYGNPLNIELPFVQMLTRCLLGKTLLFIGCGLKEDRITSILEKVISINNNLAHFAILEQPQENQYARRHKFLLKMGIMPLYYPKSQHEYIDIILDELKKKSIE